MGTTNTAWGTPRWRRGSDGPCRPEADAFPGVANMLAKEVARRGETSVALLYADQERFYTPEFRIFQSELAEYGIETVVIAESDVHVNGNGRFICPDGRHTLLVDLPFLHHNTASMPCSSSSIGRETLTS